MADTTAYPSEAVVALQKFQQWGYIDANDMASIPQATTDNVVAAFLAAGQGYTGLSVSINPDALGVTVGTGILYNLGGGYPVRSPVPVDLSPLVNLIPDTVSSQIVLIVASGGVANVQESRTLEDASLQPKNPADLWPTVQEIVTTRKVRVCTPDFVPGTVAAANPLVPPYNPLLCLLATVVLNKTGVVSVVQNAAARITRLDQLAPIVVAQGNQLSGYQALLNGLLSTVASLSKAVADGFALDRADIAAINARLTVDENKLASLSGGGTTTNNYYTYTETYQNDAGLVPQVPPTYSTGGGLGFPAQTSTPGAFSPVNPNAGNLAFLGGRYLMPAFTEVPVSVIYGKDATSFALNNVQPMSYPVLLRGLGVERTRYGAPFQAQPASNLLSNGDPTLLFAIRPGDLVYDPSWPVWTQDSPELSHAAGYWHDLTSRGYWTPRAPGTPIAGTPAAFMVFLPQADQMATSFELSVIKGTQGDIRLLVCGTVGGNTGVPDLTRVLADVTCPYASIDPTADIDGIYGVAKFKFPFPVLEKLGKTYAYVVLSTGDHRIKTASDPSIQYNAGQTNGLIFTIVTSGSPGNLGVNPVSNNALVMGHRKKIANFAQVSTPILLNPLFNGGGTDSVDVLTPAIVPQGCDITYSVQGANGGLTQLGPISASAPNLLAGRPSTVVLSATLTGTANTAPIIDIGTGGVSGTAGGSSAKQAASVGPVESRIYAIPNPAGGVFSLSKVTRVVTLIGFDPTVHTYNVEQLETAPNYAAGQAVGPTTQSAAPVKQADGTYTLTFSWSLGSPVAGVKFLMSASTTDSTRGFRSTVTTTLTT